MFHSVTLLSQAPLARGYRALLSVLLFMYSGQSCNGIQGDFRRMMNSRPLVALPQSLNLVSKMRTSIEGLETLRFCTGNEVLSCPGCKERNIKGSHGVNSSVFKKSLYFCNVCMVSIVALYSSFASVASVIVICFIQLFQSCYLQMVSDLIFCIKNTE